MVKTENYGVLQSGVQLVRTYSDENFYIQQEETGNIYEEAIDVVPLRYTYMETDEKIPEPEPESDSLKPAFEDIIE